MCVVCNVVQKVLCGLASATVATNAGDVVHAG